MPEEFDCFVGEYLSCMIAISPDGENLLLESPEDFGMVSVR